MALSELMGTLDLLAGHIYEFDSLAGPDRESESNCKTEIADSDIITIWEKVRAVWRGKPTAFSVVSGKTLEFLKSITVITLESGCN